METIRTSTTYFIPPGKFLLMENALGNPDLIQSSVSSDCRVTIVDTANFPLDELEQWPTFRLTSSDVKLKLGEGLYYVYIVVPTPDNAETTTAFISYNTVLVDRKGYDADGKLLGKEKFCYYQCGTVSARGGNPSVVTTPSGQGRVIEMDLGVTPAPSTLPGDLNDFDKMFQLDKVDPNNPKSWLLTILATVKSMTARLVRITGSLVFGSGDSEKVVTDVALSDQPADDNSVSDSILPTTAWVDSRFLRKDQDDHTPHSLSVGKNLEVDGTLYAERMQSDDFVQGSLMGSGWSVYKDANGNTVVETDTVIARKGINASELVVNQETFEKGSNIFVKGGCTIVKVEEVDGKYRCFYDNENGKRFSGFKVGDQARCQRYDSSYWLKIKYYWRLVVGVADDYVELSMTDFDGDGVPEEGDDIAQLGNRTDKTRQSAIVISPDNGGSVVVWAGIDSYNLSERNMCGMGVNPNNGRAYIYGYGDMFFGDRNLEKNFITYQIKDGDTEPTLTINADVHLSKDSTGLGNLTEFEEIKTNVDYLNNQIEREFTIWYFDDEPTLENEPAVNWVTDELKAMHDQDLYFSDSLARAWRFVNGNWVEVTDERTLAALKLADEAQKAATEAKDYINNVLPKQLEGLQNQIDGTIESYFYKYDPSLDNYPANEWITEEQKEAHLNDTFTNLESAYSWRWTKEIIPSEEEGVEPSVLYKWIEIADTATVKALAVAGKAQDTADGKRRVFVETPFTPYNVGDLWVQGETGDIMRCAVERLSGEYAESDWVKASKYTDDSSLENFIKGEYANQLKEIASQLDARAETWYQEEDPSSAWDSDALKAVHKGDLWYKISTNQTYMWTGTGWVSQGVSDEVFDIIDGKASIYTLQPSSYKKNDLWILSSDTTLDKAYKSGTIVVAKQDSDTFVASHWTKKDRYTDDSALESFLNGAYKEQLEAIQSQIDSRSETWYQVEDPSLLWDTEELKQLHIGDLWYSINDEQSFMWSGTEWVIQGVPDEVFDTIDGKASIYTLQPSSYKKNDLWILSSDTTLDKAYKSGTIVIAKQDSDTFVASHWTKKDRYTDDSALESFLNGAYKEQLEAIQSQIDSRSETWYQVEDPSLLWDTEELKQLHIGDLWYSINDKQSFMWSGTEWVIQGVPDEVFDTIDGKASIYTSQPSSYKKNDLWILSSDTTLDKAYKSGTIVVAKQDSDTFVASHWTKKDRYTDDSALESFLNGAYKEQLEAIQSQIDSRSETWYQVEDPSLLWDTEELKQLHIGDLWYSINDKQSFMWTGAEWIVQGVPDEVFDRIDGKAEIFVSKPTKYNRNDLWFLNEDITLDKAYKAGMIVVATAKSDVFNPLHWRKFDKYTDDTLAQEALKKAESFSDDLSGVLADMEIVKGQVDREFTIWYYDAEPTLYNEPAVNWNTQALIEMHDQDIYFSDSLGRAWRFVNGKWIEITDTRTIAALEKAQAAMDKASDFDYLKETFGKNENVLEGGVIMSKLVSVVNDDSQVEAFINGSDFAEDETNGKLLIAGGIPEMASDGSADLDKRASEAAYQLYENGAGSYANGNVRWTKYGTTYRKAPDFIVWTFVRNTFGENEVIDLTKGCYLDLSSYVEHQLWMPFGLPEDMTVFVRYHQASRSDYCATIQGAFYVGTEQVDGIRIDESDDGQPFELNYDKSKNRWSYRGGYYVRDGIAYLIKDASTTTTNRSIEGYTGSFTINGSNGNYALSFENGLLKTYKYTNTSGGN